MQQHIDRLSHVIDSLEARDKGVGERPQPGDTVSSMKNR
jgi:hypothetical protein